MKKILLSITLVASLVCGSTLAVADTSTKTNGQTIQAMSAQKAINREAKKGLDEAVVVPNGQDSWMLHQPVERYPQYFGSSVDKQMGNKASSAQDNQRS